VRSGSHVEPTNVTVRELMESWLETGKRRGFNKRKQPWKIQTYLGNKMHADRYIIPKFGALPVAKLRKGAIEQAGQEWKEDSGITGGTVNKIFGTMHAALKFALRNTEIFGIKSNPMLNVERLANERPAPDTGDLESGEIADHGDRPSTEPGALREIRPDEVYSVLELKKIIEASAPGLERALLMTAIFTGLRHGELCGLRWPMVDFKKGVLFVNRSLTQLSKKHGGPTLEDPKTKKGKRHLEMPAALVGELRRWKLACPPTPNQFVFVNALGKPTSRKENNDALKTVCGKAEVRPLSMNNLRHSFASQQLIGGTTPLEVSFMMGHSSPAVTLAIYSHWCPREKSQAQARLANRIFGASEETAAEAEGQKN
jgi:integrase